MLIPIRFNSDLFLCIPHISLNNKHQYFEHMLLFRKYRSVIIMNSTKTCHHMAYQHYLLAKKHRINSDFCSMNNAEQCNFPFTLLLVVILYKPSPLTYKLCAGDYNC